MIHLSFLAEPLLNSDILAERGDALLNAEERSRLLRYTREEPKRQLLVSRWLIHEQLARSFPCIPRRWMLSRDAQGRPSAEHPELDNPIKYSLSHCMGLIACVVSDNLEVGIDAEPKNQPLKNSFVDVGFTPLEQDQIRRSINQQSQEMRQRWTIKESLGKMTGLVGFDAIVGCCTGTLSCLQGNAPTFLSEQNAWIYFLPVSNNHFVTLVAPKDGIEPPEVKSYDSSQWMDQSTL